MSDPSESPWDLIVVGGGAAGFFGAISAAETCTDNRRVLILEKTSQVLGKVRISGGGRCNVTHACFEPRRFATHFPRGEKELIGPLNRWGPAETIQWFEQRGVALKTEPDGRMFPTTDDSQTIIDCLLKSARQAGIEIQLTSRVTSISRIENKASRFVLTTASGKGFQTRNLLIATGGTRAADIVKYLQSFGHTLHPAVPSLFTFTIPGSSLKDLAGISVPQVELNVPGLALKSEGPVLVTHWGLSGPAVLKLSAWGARALHDVDYTFTLQVNWIPGQAPEAVFDSLRCRHGKRGIASSSPFPAIPRRLWERLIKISGIPESTSWSQLSRIQSQFLATNLTRGSFSVTGKSLNKDEFVTCGGVVLDELNLRTLESRLVPGLYFAGEVLDIDGITGGFNFQNAWTSGYLAGRAIATDY